MSELKTKEPLVRIIKRDKSSFGYKVWVRAAAIITGTGCRCNFHLQRNRTESVIRICSYV